MIVSQLIKKLQDLPQDYSVRIEYCLSDDTMDMNDIIHNNYWVDSIELHKRGSSGYPNGEIVILGGE